MRWGLIGTGRHALERIVPALATAGGELGGVVGSRSARAEAFVARVGYGRAFPTVAALLADDSLEAVFISTPNDQHCAQGIAVATAGKHVLVEKPMALNEAECHAMIAAAAEAGVVLGVGFQQRHAPVHRALHQLIRDRALGEIVLMRGEWHTAYPAWQNWRADLARAGSDVLSAVGVHVLDLLCWLTGSEVVEVTSLIDRSRAGGADRTMAALLRFADGPIATMTATSRARAATNSVWVLGTRGCATAVGSLGMAPAARLDTFIDGVGATRELSVVDLYAAQFCAFEKAVASGSSPSANGLDGLRSVALSGRILAEAG